MRRKPTFSKSVKKQTLAEQVADTIKEAIVAGDWPPGAVLPTEPELAADFGVSRAVIRDATRMLVAQGLVDAQHGRGVFVTASQVEAFGEALLLALRRAEATVWDVEQFEQLIYPEVAALAAQAITDEELAHLEQLLAVYLSTHREVWGPESPEPTPVGEEAARQAYLRFVEAIFGATHNAVLMLLAKPLVQLHSTRNWDPGEGDDTPYEDLLALEQETLQAMIEAVASRDPQHARQVMQALLVLPPAAEKAMRRTPVGETPVIPLPYKRWREG